MTLQSTADMIVFELRNAGEPLSSVQIELLRNSPELEKLVATCQSAQTRIAKIEQDGFHFCAGRDYKPIDYDVSYCSMCYPGQRWAQLQAECDRLRNMVIGLEAIIRSGKGGCQYNIVYNDAGELVGVAEIDMQQATAADSRQRLEPVKIANYKNLWRINR